jgi:hypothetical protein
MKDGPAAACAGSTTQEGDERPAARKGQNGEF